MLLSRLRLLAIAWFCTVVPIYARAQVVDPSQLGAYIQNQISNQPLARQSPDLFEKAAAEYRGQNSETLEGELKLLYFYRGFSDQARGGTLGDLLARWRTQFPQSPTPDIIEADALVADGLGALSPAFYDVIATLNAKPDQERLDKARELLTRNASGLSSDPQWYILMAMIGIATQQDERQFVDLINEGLRRNPRNLRLAAVGATYFLPKWYGDAEKFDRFARDTADLASAEGSPGVYFHIYRQAFQLEYRFDLFRRSKVRWSRMKQDIGDTLKRNPGTANRNEAALFACLAGDRLLTKSLLSDRQFPYGPYYWRGDEYFTVCKVWSDGPRPNPNEVEH